MEKSKKIPLNLLLILFVLLIVLVGIMLSGKFKSAPSPIVQPTPTPVKSALKFAVVNQKVAVGTPLVLEVLADSNFEDVVGYDVLVGYDNKAFTFRTASPSNTSYQLFNTSKPAADHLSMTAVKRLSVQDKITFANQSLLTLTFTPTKKGRHTFQILPTVGLEKTKLVNDKIKVSQPRVETVTVEVE